MALLIAALPLRAQTTPKSYTACYVASTGTVYRINKPAGSAPGLAPECDTAKKTPDVEFTWTDGDKAVRLTDAAGGDLAGTFGSLTVSRLLGRALATTPPTDGQVLQWDATTSTWMPRPLPSGVTAHSQLTGLTSGDDHTQYLPANGTRVGSTGFAVTGALGSGSPPVSGGGVRMMWLPWAAAFRAGRVEANQWDPGAIGESSVAMGWNTKATTTGSTAFGIGTEATGGVSTAIGSGAKATGDYALAFGRHSTAAGPSSAAIGGFTTATGEGAMALGWYTTAGAYALSAGINTVASGAASVALGQFASTNNQPGSFVFGDRSTGPNDPLVTATAPHQFVARASGGFRFRTTSDLSTGCDISAGNLTCTGTITGASGLTDHGALQGLSDDDHPQYLLANGSRTATTGFAVTGALGSGSTPVVGAGVRMMWLPWAAAIRAGRVEASQWDPAAIGESSVAMGWNTKATTTGSTAFGIATEATGGVSTALGSGAKAQGDYSLAFGRHTTANGPSSAAIGGFTTANGEGAVALGWYTTASAYGVAAGINSVASGMYSVALGPSNIASGEASLALGRYASTNNQAGAVVFGDNSTHAAGGTYVTATAPNQFVGRASGGVRLYSSSDLSTGVTLAPGGGSWENVSDVRKKTAFSPVDGERILANLASMPVQTWQYKAQQGGVRHMGPTAQDFHRAFGLGESDTTITTVDADGVALASVRALEVRTRELRAESAALRNEVAALRRSVVALRDNARVRYAPRTRRLTQPSARSTPTSRVSYEPTAIVPRHHATQSKMSPVAIGRP